MTARAWWTSPSCCCALTNCGLTSRISYNTTANVLPISGGRIQDTNNIQYAWIRLLAGDTGKVMIVGDDDQSIYGWRGAQVENIQRFLNDFPGAETIRLEQNYRSTSNILSAANALIENNNGRLGKKLWTDGADGEPISLYCAFNELDEARFVVNRIKTWQDNGGALAECAILYRSNAQSRVLEEALLQASMPYRIYGGMRFFERRKSKTRSRICV